MQVVPIKDLNLGGLADSDYQGIANSLKAIIGLDLHSIPGLIKVQQKLAKDSGSTIDEFVKNMVSCSDGNTYLFSSGSGKIWSRTGAGVYALEATNANGACLGAIEYNGYIYYASATKLGRVAKGSAWSTRTDSWATFTNGDTGYHPMFVKNGTLYIGDGNLLAQVDDAGVFVADALDIPKPYRISSLGSIGENIVLGTFVSSNVLANRVFLWDTWSISWATDDEVFEDGVNCFLQMDNATVLQAGSKGNIYAYDGNLLTQIKKIAGTWTGTNKGIVYNQSSVLFNGQTLIGLSNVSGNPASQGVYAFGSYASNYPKILTLDYPISTGNLTGVEIGAITQIENNILVSWKDTTGGTTYGVDKIDTSNKYTSAYLESRIYQLDRRAGKTVGVNIAYKTLPTSTNIVLKTATNHGSYTTQTLVKDTDRKCFTLQEAIVNANTFQFKIEFTVNSNDAPELEGIDLIFF